MSATPLIRPKQLAAELGVSVMWLYRHESVGDLPARVRLGVGTTGWWRSEIEAWKASRPRGAAS